MICMRETKSDLFIASYINNLSFSILHQVKISTHTKTNHDVTSAKCTQYIYIYVTSGGSLVSPSIKTDHHVKTEVWLKLVLDNTMVKGKNTKGQTTI
jgi:hypothetical protein